MIRKATAEILTALNGKSEGFTKERAAQIAKVEDKQIASLITNGHLSPAEKKTRPQLYHVSKKGREALKEYNKEHETTKKSKPSKTKRDRWQMPKYEVVYDPAWKKGKGKNGKGN